MSKVVTFEINGQQHEIAVEPYETLLWVLRKQSHLKQPVLAFGHQPGQHHTPNQPHETGGHRCRKVKGQRSADRISREQQRLATGTIGKEAHRESPGSGKADGDHAVCPHYNTTTPKA